jgi:hypothetical protein
MIVVNLGSETSIPLNRYKEMLDGHTQLTNALSGENFGISETLQWTKEETFAIFKVH